MGGIQVDSEKDLDRSQECVMSVKPSENSSHCKSQLTIDSSEAVKPSVLRMLTPVEGASEVQGETVEGGSFGDREICASPATVDGGRQKRKL